MRFQGIVRFLFFFGYSFSISQNGCTTISHTRFICDEPHLNCSANRATEMHWMHVKAGGVQLQMKIKHGLLKMNKKYSKTNIKITY